MKSKASKLQLFGSSGRILIPNETPNKMLPCFHLRWNMFFIWDQTVMIFFHMILHPTFLIYDFHIFRTSRETRFARSNRWACSHGTMVLDFDSWFFARWVPSQLLLTKSLINKRELLWSNMKSFQLSGMEINLGKLMWILGLIRLRGRNCRKLRVFLDLVNCP